MEKKKLNTLPESFAMNGGDGPNSYAQNSSYQRGVVEAAKEIINKEVAAKLDIKQLSLLSSLNPYRIADFGCSTGPNTFLGVQNIIEAIELKFQSLGLNSQTPEFQVFFNDHISNDFNSLFQSLPPERRYHAAGVPGSFYGRLFPKASLHFGYSSCALNWVSEVPIGVTDKTSVSWNKGRIHYTGAKKEVFEAYSAQFAKDMESFLHARAQELVGGGLMALLVPAVSDFSESTTGLEFELLGSCLMDMAKMGLVSTLAHEFTIYSLRLDNVSSGGNWNISPILLQTILKLKALMQGLVSEAKVDSFNLPIYYTSPKELTGVIERNGYFNIERMETLNNPKKHILMPNLKLRILYIRAVVEGMIEKHFGSGIMDELFDRYSKKAAESSFFLNPDMQKLIVLFVFLKRNVNK